MPYVKYDPAIKVAAVHMLIDGLTDDEVRNALHEPIHSKSFRRWTELYHETHAVIRDPHLYKRRGRPRLYGPADRDFIEELVRTDASLFLDEIRDQVYDERGVWVSISTLQVELHHRLQLTLKKANVRHCKRSGYARQKFLDELSQFPAEYLVFTDESAICERDLLRFNAHSPKGEPSYRTVRNMSAKRYSLLPAIGVKGVLAVKVKEGSIKRLDFEKFLKYRLLPRMQPYPAPNSVLILDNAQIHKGGRIAKLCRDAGIMLRYLPPYCPDLNPIETAFSVLKTSFRRTQSLQNVYDIRTELVDRTCDIFVYDLLKKLYSYSGYEEVGL